MSKFFAVFFIWFLLLARDSFGFKTHQQARLDSIKVAAKVRRHAAADSIRQNIVPVVYSLEYADTLLLQLDTLHTTLNDITNESEYGFRTGQIEEELAQMQLGVQVMSQSLSRDSTVLNINNLQMFRGLLKDMEDKLSDWRTTLYENNGELIRLTAEMNGFTKDSFTQKVAADTSFANLHLEEMIVLNEKWKEAQKSTNADLDHISKLLAKVSDTYFTVTEMENIVRLQLAGAGGRCLKRGYNYIWNAHSYAKFDETAALTALSYTERMQILGYYLRLNVRAWLTILLIGLVFFIWVARNFRLLKRAAPGAQDSTITFRYISRIPLLSMPIFILAVAPYYALDQPAIYMEVIQILMLIPLTMMLARIWPRGLFGMWCILIFMLLLTSAMNAVITPGWQLRLLLIGLNVAAVGFGVWFAVLYQRSRSLGVMLTVAIAPFVLMQAASIVANVAGRVTLAKILTSGGMFSLPQAIGLLVTVQILTEAFHLQMQSRRVSAGMTAHFDFAAIQKGLFQLLTIVAIIFWSITFATHLAIYYYIVDLLDTFLNTPHGIGSTSFTIGNIMTFILVLYVVNLTQRYIGYFFGETEDDLSSDLDKKQSRLLLFRLIIIVIGFFIAVVASGLPVDKVTVVLGALGVGIGLGLQNLVYNLVSGIVLIFEKPMQIGDYVEVSDKKGRVQNIGIRSSTLRTDDGSEIIVPNGDFLSSHMVNWTRGNNNRRAEFVISIEAASDLQAAKDVIIAELKTNSFVIQGRPVEILFNNLSGKSANLTAQVWITSIYKEQEFKSDALTKIYARLAEKGIKIV